MHIGLIIFVSIVIILWVLVKNRLQNDNTKDNNVKSQDAMEPNEENIEMTDIFYEEVRNGETTYKLMNVFNQFDLMFIKSLFQSEQIPHYIESEHVSRIRPGMQIGSFGNADVYILEKDYDDAVRIIEEYRKNKEKNYSEKQTIRKPVEVLVGSWPVPEADDTNGIIIRYKK
jgi:DNA modification methylase